MTMLEQGPEGKKEPKPEEVKKVDAPENLPLNEGTERTCNNPECQQHYFVDPDAPSGCPHCGTPPYRPEGVPL